MEPAYTPDQLNHAVAQLREMVRREPNHAQAWHELGVALHMLGQLEDAIAPLRRAVELAPDREEFVYNLALTLRRTDRIDEAKQLYARTLEINPRHFNAYNNLGNLYRDEGRLQEAIDAFTTSLSINPGFPYAYNNRGTAYQDQMRLDEAIADFRKAVDLAPDYVNARDNLLLCLNYHDGWSAEAIFEAHRAFGAYYEPAVKPARPRRMPSPSGRIRVGYLSADFRRHSVAFFIWPVLANHDKSRFEITCYSDVVSPDIVTEKLSALPQRWRTTTRLSDDLLAQQIHADRIDILIDLAGHAGSNRLRMLARRVAPVQATWLGYPNTTGLTNIDYRITDPIVDPPGTTESLHSETLYRLPSTFFCYAPRPGGPEYRTTTPAADAGHVTFAVFTNFSKVRPAALRAWASVLRAVPSSRLLLQAKSLVDPATRQTVLDAFAQAGVSSERVTMQGLIDFPQYMEQYNGVDIVLDTFPFVGHTTSCHALWMGVPVVTLAGRTHRERMGASLLTNLGLSELVAHSESDYVRIATELAGDIGRLSAIRAGLRTRIVQSAVGDDAGFTRTLENAYAHMLEGV